MEFEGYQSIAIRRSSRVTHATLNRPESLNAIDDVLHAELNRLFADVTHDAETSVVVLTGAGRAFSAGGDLVHMQKVIDEPDLLLGELALGKQLIYSILDCPKPVIAKINGPALGLGATIALFCDITIASSKARIGDSHVKVGLVPGDGGTVIWPALVGYARAKEFLFTGDALTGEEAARIGLINRSVSPEELDRTVDELAQRLARGPAKAIQWTKLAINIGLRRLAESMLESSLRYEALSNRTRDHQEAVTALREKRAPQFTGE